MTTEQTEQIDPVYQNLVNSLSPMTQMSPRLRLLIYGDPGVGKSTLAAGAPRNMYIDVDKNMAPIFNFPELVANIQRYNFTTLENFETLISYLEVGHFSAAETITVDKISDISFVALERISTRQAAMSGGNPFFIDNDYYKESNERVRRILMRLKQLDKNLIVISSAKTIESALTKIMTTMPEFSERMVGHITAMFNVVGYMYREEDATGKVTRFLRVQPLTNIVAKCFTENALPPLLINPTWDTLFNAYSALRQSSSS